MCCTTMLSMWLSNTSTTAMVMPIVEAVLQELINAEEEQLGPGNSSTEEAELMGTVPRSSSPPLLPTPIPCQSPLGPCPTWCLSPHLHPPPFTHASCHNPSTLYPGTHFLLTLITGPSPLFSLSQVLKLYCKTRGFVCIYSPAVPTDQREGEEVTYHTSAPAPNPRVHPSLSSHVLCFFTTTGLDVNNRQTSVELIFVNEE